MNSSQTTLLLVAAGGHFRPLDEDLEEANGTVCLLPSSELVPILASFNGEVHLSRNHSAHFNSEESNAPNNSVELASGAVEEYRRHCVRLQELQTQLEAYRFKGKKGCLCQLLNLRMQYKRSSRADKFVM